MELICRKAGLRDWEAVYRLICEMEGEQLPGESFFEIYRIQERDRRYYCLVCEHKGAVVGVLNLRFEEQLHHAGRIAEIMEFAVANEYRSQGIGREMLAAACRLAKEAGCELIEAASNQVRKEAHRFYLREGMRASHFKFSKSPVE